MVLSNDYDLLNPPAELEKRKHKLKRLVQSPNSFFMDVKCQEPPFSAIHRRLLCAAIARQCCASPLVGVPDSLRAAPSVERVTDVVGYLYSFCLLEKLMMVVNDDFV
ncbi:hypothetical protein DH2020_042448 [Rehmannia glutinosa]|uniref:Uncharacterized protein n=1 Tax=Rehmannia glutinosa TaxID=99300 RepID=A0ABR0UNE8_REHGL